MNAIFALAICMHLLARASTSTLSRLMRLRGTWTRVEAMIESVRAKKTGSVLSIRAVRLAMKVGL